MGKILCFALIVGCMVCVLGKGTIDCSLWKGTIVRWVGGGSVEVEVWHGDTNSSNGSETC